MVTGMCCLPPHGWRLIILCRWGECLELESFDYALHVLLWRVESEAAMSLWFSSSVNCSQWRCFCHGRCSSSWQKDFPNLNTALQLTCSFWRYVYSQIVWTCAWKWSCIAGRGEPSVEEDDRSRDTVVTHRPSIQDEKVRKNRCWSLQNRLIIIFLILLLVFLLSSLLFILYTQYWRKFYNSREQKNTILNTDICKKMRVRESFLSCLWDWRALSFEYSIFRILFE